MGYTTRVDEARSELKSNLKSAIDNCITILDPESWGYEEYSKEFKHEIAKLQNVLMENYIDL